MDIGYSSKIGVKVAPPLDDFHTPPPADPTYTTRGLSATPSIAAMRPLVTAGPSARARTSPIAAESSTAGACAARPAGTHSAATKRARFMTPLMDTKKGGRDCI